MSRRFVSIIQLSPAAQRQVVEQIGEQERAKHKYHAERTQLDGLWFASKKEARRYAELVHLVRASQIKSLTLQERFDLTIGDVKITTYVADFSYIENGVKVVEDTKGVITPVYRIKKKLMKALLGIVIKEI